MTTHLVDERCSPSLRTIIGRMLRHATHADFAIGHVRLCAIDLSTAELSHVRSCRLLLDRLDVEMLNDAADVMAGESDLARNLEQLLHFAESGRLQLRSAVTPSWCPDFSVFHGLPVSEESPAGDLCLMGAHYFSRPVMLDGASFTCILSDATAIASAQDRFSELWNNAHDVLPVVRGVLASCVSG
jgi:hypothetical protein